jgi:hypothetical protein
MTQPRYSPDDELDLSTPGAVRRWAGNHNAQYDRDRSGSASSISVSAGSTVASGVCLDTAEPAVPGRSARLGNLRRGPHAGRPAQGAGARRPGRALHAGGQEAGRRPRATRDRVHSPVPARPGSASRGARRAGQPADEDRLADHHRGWLQLQPGHGRVRRGQPGGGSGPGRRLRRAPCSASWSRPCAAAATSAYRRSR